jgi:hypothetical protein
MGSTRSRTVRGVATIGIVDVDKRSKVYNAEYSNDSLSSRLRLLTAFQRIEGGILEMNHSKNDNTIIITQNQSEGEEE